MWTSSWKLQIFWKRMTQLQWEWIPSQKLDFNHTPMGCLRDDFSRWMWLSMGPQAESNWFQRHPWAQGFDRWLDMGRCNLINRKTMTVCIYIYVYIYIQLWTISIHGHQSIFILHVYICVCVWENYGEHRGESKCIGIGYIVIPQYFHHSGKAASWSSLRPFPSDFQISQVLMFFVSSRIQTSSTRTMPPCLPHVHTNTFTHGPVFLL
jgi:hypothetical protein